MQNEQTPKVKVPTYGQYLKRYEKQVGLRKQNFEKQEEDPFMTSPNKTAAIRTIQKFISKFKMENKNQESILQEMQSLNLSKYTDEIANIIVNSLTEKDIQFYAEVSTKLNKEYANVPSIIIEYLKKLFTSLFQSPQDNKGRLKAVLMFTTQLFVCGFAFSYKEIRQMLIKIFKSGNKKKNSIDNETEKKLFAFYYNSECFVDFLVNYWEQFTRLSPKWMTEWKQQNLAVKEFPLTTPPTLRQELTKFFLKYIAECENVLLENVELIKQYQKELKDNLRMEGEFNKQNQKKYINLVSLFNATKDNLRLICLAANQPFNDEKLNFKIHDVAQIMKSYVNTDGDAEVFQNEYEKEIYENLPEFTREEAKSSEADYREFKEKLDKCKNVSDADTLAKDFEKFNNKKNRKLLVKDILQYRKQYYLVTPYLCRIASIVNHSFKDVAEMVNQALFNQYQKMKQNSGTAFIVTDKKNRNWKYLCEFTKFKLIDPQKIIACLHHLIQDLKGHNIELLIFALQNVGRFIYLSHKTANKFTFLLNKLENVLKQKSFPMLTSSRLFNIMTLIKPVAETEQKVEKVLTEEEKEVIEILNVDITGELDETIKKIRKFLSRGKKFVEAFNTILVQKILDYNFIGNYNYAFLLYEINEQEVSIHVINTMISTLIQSIKSYEYQKSMISARFIGELFKYELLKKSQLYNTLENILLIKGNQVGVINTICTVLETCIGYLDSKKILSQNNKFRFLFSFKKYLKNCKYIPMMEEFKIIDIYEAYQEKYLCTLGLQYVEQFMLVFDGKKDRQQKELNLSRQFDKYIEKKCLKQKQPEIETKDDHQFRKKQNEKFIDQDEEQDKKNHLQLVKAEAKNFQTEFNFTLNANIKDFSSRMTKQTFLQKTIEKKKEKKRPQNEKVITVIGRSGNRFIKKDVGIKEQKINALNGSKIEEPKGIAKTKQKQSEVGLCHTSLKLFNP